MKNLNKMVRIKGWWILLALICFSVSSFFLPAPLRVFAYFIGAWMLIPYEMLWRK